MCLFRIIVVRTLDESGINLLKFKEMAIEEKQSMAVFFIYMEIMPYKFTLLKVNTMDYLGREWEITPAGGATGEAFIARHDEQKLFLKRNSSPFLAVLSAEGIVPKLIWTKRLENGDVITAQEWMNGRELTPAEMCEESVAELLQKIHQSTPLLNMLRRLGKTTQTPIQILASVKNSLDGELKEDKAIKETIHFLEQHVNDVKCDHYVVCHGDINHNNLLLCDEGNLYLVDWDEAIIADPAMDIGMLLYSYVEKDQWEQWLANYGLSLTPELRLRMKWFVLTQMIQTTALHKKKNRLADMNRCIEYLSFAQEY